MDPGPRSGPIFNAIGIGPGPGPKPGPMLGPGPEPGAGCATAWAAAAAVSAAAKKREAECECLRSMFVSWFSVLTFAGDRRPARRPRADGARRSSPAP